MPTIPEGLPALTRTASIEYYGGHVDKSNYMSQGSINPRTDVSAEQLCRLAADLVAVVRVAPVATLIVQNDDTSPDDPTVVLARLQTGIQASSYAGDAPPTGFPTVTRSSDGVFVVTFDTTISDDFGVSATVDLKGGLGGCIDSNSADVTAVIADPNADGYYERITFTVDDGAAVTDALVLVEIY